MNSSGRWCCPHSPESSADGCGRLCGTILASWLSSVCTVCTGAHCYTSALMLRFRRLRRLTAIAAHLLLLQLVFTSAAGACPLGDGTAQATTVSSGANHADHHAMQSGAMDSAAPIGSASTSAAPAPQGHGPAPAPAHHHRGAHCDMTCAPASCGAAGHCSTSAVSSSPTPPAGLASADGRRIVARRDAPRSVSTAPEPPPPRA